MVYGLNRSAVVDPPPFRPAYLKCLKKCGRFSNFEFWLIWYLDIVKKNLYTDFGQNPTNWIKIIT